MPISGMYWFSVVAHAPQMKNWSNIMMLNRTIMPRCMAACVKRDA